MNSIDCPRCGSTAHWVEAEKSHFCEPCDCLTGGYSMFVMGDKYASIGFIRDDGDFELLATYNNGADYMEDDAFFAMVQSTVTALKGALADDVIALCREDAIDVVVFD